jgi:hypothetical protein
MPPPTLVIINPVCGPRTAPSVAEATVLPLLTPGRPSVRVVTTKAVNHAGLLLREFIESLDPQERQVDVVLLSGDGTLQELLNAAMPPTVGQIQINIALLPCGTANALYHSLFNDTEHPEWLTLSLQALLLGRSSPLRIARTTFIPTYSDQSISSSVVVSTALHAMILDRSEHLRATHPGIERFKMAAMENITRWYDAKAVLRGRVQRYHVTSQSFVDLQSNYSDGGVDLDGPFSYFLSTSTVDRLEAKFVIMPLQKRLPPSTDDSLDIIVVRPLRDPTISDSSEESRGRFVQTIGQALKEAYNDGAHVDLRYPSEDGLGEEIVEYYRCQGWDWIPFSTDDNAHLVCIDGQIISIKKGGKAVCSALPGGSKDEAVKFYVSH